METSYCCYLQEEQDSYVTWWLPVVTICTFQQRETVQFLSGPGRLLDG